VVKTAGLVEQNEFNGVFTGIVWRPSLPSVVVKAYHQRIRMGRNKKLNPRKRE
jgi:hypothetical protein